MNGKLIYLNDTDEYIFITPMGLTPQIKDEMQEDMNRRLGKPVAVISDCTDIGCLSGEDGVEFVKYN